MAFLSVNIQTGPSHPQCATCWITYRVFMPFFYGQQSTSHQQHQLFTN